VTGNEFQTLGEENRKARHPYVNFNCGGGLKADENCMSADIDVAFYTLTDCARKRPEMPFLLALKYER